MIPAWKLKREVDRLLVQAKAIPLALYEPFVQRRHDAARGRTIKTSTGALPQGANLAIFLIFQPKGVAPSVLTTCGHLVASGFSPIVISNCPLAPDDRTALQDLSCQVIERPNFGYDFGGYRDGVWSIQQSGATPESVLFLNDSVWFPVTANSTLLTDMLADPGEYIGTQVFGDVTRSGRARAFFGSYCFLIKRPLWQHPAFQGFWADYRVSSNKEITLRRGERAFSRQMLETTDKARATFDLTRFMALVDGLSDEGLVEAIRDMVVTAPDLERRQTDLIAAGELALPDDMRALLHASAASKNYIGAAPILSLRELGFPMIKKNNERHYMLARHRILRAADESRLPGLDPVILDEIRQSCA